MIKRELFSVLKKDLFKNKALILLGPRQTGKTTLVKEIGELKKTRYFTADEQSVVDILSKRNISNYKRLSQGYEIIIIDEAQRIPDIGMVIKLWVDNIPEIQIIATGSSSFELANNINEPLTGRKYQYHLYPISHRELVSHTDYYEENSNLENRLIYGSYPEVINNPGDEERILYELENSYLYKDIFSFDKIKKRDVFFRVVRAIAFRIGQQVSSTSIGRDIGTDNQTVDRYIDLLEKMFIIFRLPSYHRNMNKELKKSKKIYFYDNGIRNAVIRNFNPKEFRDDWGALWENYIISERMKTLSAEMRNPLSFFWRTKDQKEIDYLEEENGILSAYEIKYNKSKVKIPKAFADSYPDSRFNIITSENYSDFLKQQ